MGKLFNRFFLWLDKKELCPCGLSYRIVQKLKLTNSENRLVLFFLGSGLSLCSWIINRLPDDKVEQVKEYSTTHIVKTKSKEPSNLKWN